MTTACLWLLILLGHPLPHPAPGGSREAAGPVALATAATDNLPSWPEVRRQPYSFLICMCPRPVSHPG